METHKGIYPEVIKTLQSNIPVYLCTYYKITKLTKKNLDQIRLDKKGWIEIKHGKNWISYYNCAVRYNN